MTTKPNDAIPRPRMIEAAQHAANTISDLANAGGSARSVSFALANLVTVALDERHAAGQGEPKLTEYWNIYYSSGGYHGWQLFSGPHRSEPDALAEVARLNARENGCTYKAVHFNAPEGAAEAKPGCHECGVVGGGHRFECLARYKQKVGIAEPPSPVAGDDANLKPSDGFFSDMPSHGPLDGPEQTRAIRRIAVYLDEQHAAGQGERLGGRSASEFVQERIAEKSRVEGAAEAKPCGHRSTQCTDQEHCVKPEGHAGYCRYEAAPVAEPPSPVADARCFTGHDFMEGASRCRTCGIRASAVVVRSLDQLKARAEGASPVAGEPDFTLGWSVPPIPENILRAEIESLKFQFATVEAERDHYRDKKRLGDQREASLLDDIKQAESANARAERLEAERPHLLQGCEYALQELTGRAVMPKQDRWRIAERKRVVAAAQSRAQAGEPPHESINAHLEQAADLLFALLDARPRGDVGRTYGHAHTGSLNDAEFKWYVAERKRRAQSPKQASEEPK